MKRSSLHDFTPLIDVFLILLFAVLLHAEFSKAQLLDAHTATSEALFSENTHLSLSLKNLIDAIDSEQLEAIEDKSKFEFLKNHVTFVDVTIRTRFNQVWINGVSTPYVFYPPDAHDPLQIREELRKTFADFVNRHPSDLYVVSLGEDGYAYRYTYLTLQELLQEIKDMTDKPVYFRTLTQGGF